VGNRFRHDRHRITPSAIIQIPKQLAASFSGSPIKGQPPPRAGRALHLASSAQRPRETQGQRVHAPRRGRAGIGDSPLGVALLDRRLISVNPTVVGAFSPSRCRNITSGGPELCVPTGRTSSDPCGPSQSPATREPGPLCPPAGCPAAHPRASDRAMHPRSARHSTARIPRTSRSRTPLGLRRNGF
jgi:hypothetical protein